MNTEEFKYQVVNGVQIGKDWLASNKTGEPIPIQNYRNYLLTSLIQARENYLKRAKEQGIRVPESLSKRVDSNINMKTCEPPAPDFA